MSRTANTSNQAELPETERPDVYAYHDYRAFLKDWVTHLKKAEPGFSLRKLATQCGLSASFLSMVLSGKRNFSEEQINQLLLHLRLDSSEQSYVQWLRLAVEAPNQEGKINALKRIQRFRKYKKLHPLEFEAYHYLTHWYYVAIRELSLLSDFSTDTSYIQSKLKYPLRTREIEKALAFLTEQGFLQEHASGKMEKPAKRIVCDSMVLKPSMAQFHKEMLEKALDSIDDTPSSDRHITSHTCAIPQDSFEEARAILNEALDRIAKLAEKPGQRSDVYHFALQAFPLTRKQEDEA